MQESTIAGIFVEMLIAGAAQQGIDVDNILLKHGISRLSVKNSSHRVPVENFAYVAVDLMQAMDDEFLGLTSTRQPLGSFNMMCRASISTKTIKHSVQRCANFWNLFNNTFRHEVLISGGRIHYHLNRLPDGTLLNNYGIESLLSSIHRFHCWLGGQFIPLLSVSLDYAEPDYSEAYKPLFYGAPIRYQQAQAGIEFEARYGNLDIIQTADTLDRYLEGQNLSLLNQPKRYRAFSDQVRRWLEKCIQQGRQAPGLADAAKHFQLSQQVLHRRLRAENSSFKELKMQTRRDLAINLLFSDRYRIDEIANRTGFSEPSAFIRAFKTWTGETPLQYRQKNAL